MHVTTECVLVKRDETMTYSGRRERRGSGLFFGKSPRMTSLKGGDIVRQYMEENTVSCVTLCKQEMF